jgi:hypothetical protein
MRPVGIAAFWLSLAVLVGALASGGGAGAALGLQDATPGAAPPAATPIAVSQIVTLVGWYAPSQDQSYLVITPIADAPDLVSAAGPVPAGQQPGRADFPEEGLPTIQLGETTFSAYSLNPDDPNAAYRWLWFDDTETLRPATLVLQVTASGGRYEGWVGTATFVSRGENAGGVLVIMVEPPAESAAAEAAPVAAAVEVPRP